MDFFKSVFSPDPDPSDSPSDSPRHPHHHDDGRQEEPLEEEEDDEETPNPNPSHSSGSWNWLVQTIATKSESVIETYRRDLEEFGYGLKKETEAIKEVATRAVRDLPGSLEAGASVAQESIESVGHAIDEFGGSVWRGTAEIISHGKEALLAVDSDSGSPDSNPASSSKRYGRFEVQVLAFQNDPNTYAEEPEDGENFGKWKLGFRLEEKEEEIEGLLYDNGVLEGLFEKFVPGVLDQETFWSRYFYRVYKLKQAEDARAKFVARVISREEDEEEELSWEVDDDDDDDEDKKEEENKNENKKVEETEKEEENKNENKKEEETEKEEENKNENSKETEKLIERGAECVEENKPTEEAKKEEIVETELAKEEVGEPLVSEEEKKPTEASQVENLEEEENVKSKIEENRSPSEAISERTESSKDKDSDFSVVSSQPSMQEDDDLEWDEIEDLGEHDDKKVEGSGGSPRKVDLRKRLSAADEDEDLSWDIDDDEDEPIKT